MSGLPFAACFADTPEPPYYAVVFTSLRNGVDAEGYGEASERMMALEWHYYRFELPAGAVPLARNALCWQAYRLGEAAWGLQFHAETTRTDWLRWIDEWDSINGADRTGFDPAQLRADTEAHIGRWNELGFGIATRFLEAAERG